VVAGAPYLGQYPTPGAAYVFGPPRPALSPVLLPHPTYAASYPSQTITATEVNYSGSFTYATQNVHLPNGMSLSASNTGVVLSGTPTSIGSSFSFTVTATDSFGLTGSQPYFLTVDKATPTINVTANDSIYNGSPYTVGAVNVAGQNNTTLASLTVDPSTLSFTWYMGTGTSGTNLGSNAPKDAGTYTVVAHYTSDNASYSNADSTPMTFTITPKTLLVNGLSATNKIYDATTTDPLSGTAALLAAEAAGAGSTSDGKPYTGDTVMLGGTAVGTFATKDAGSGILVKVTGNSLTGAQVGDYVLSSTDEENGALTGSITPKALTYSGLSVPANRMYNGKTNAVVSGTAVLQTPESPGTGSTSDSKPYSGDSVGLTGTPTGTYNSKDVATATTVTFGGLSLTGANNADYSLTAGMQAATITPQTVLASIIGNPTKPYDGTTSATLIPANFSLSGLAGTESFTVTQTSGVYNSPNVATATTVTASLTAGNFTPGNGTLASNYTLPSTASGPGQITPALLSASGVNFSATAGAPFSGTVATFTTPETVDGAGAFSASILWGDGSTSNGIVMGSKGSFTVSGSHTFADPKASPGYAVSVQISNPNTQSAMANDTATVTSLGQGVVKGLTATIGFWNNQNGQALITSFNVTANTPKPTALASWLKATFPNLYGNLAITYNADVAAYFQTLFNQGAPKVQAQVLAVALNVYATTASLGGNAGVAYGFSVSATGLGADSFNVGSDGAAFGVANNTTRNVYELLLAVNNQASNGILYNGNPMRLTLQGETGDLFTSLNQAGDIG
jgi:hypothetical protein